MIRLLTDEDFNHRMLAGVRRRLPELDILSAQELGLRTSRDPVILQFAADEDRVVLSHDVTTMDTFARARIVAEMPMPGLLLINQNHPIGPAIDEIVTVAMCSKHEEWRDIIMYLPM